MRNILNILLCFLLSYSIGNAQSIKRDVISSFGASSTISNTIVESTLGQPSNIGTVSDGNNYIRQGFQQPINQLSTPCVVSVLDSQNVTCFGGNDGYIQVGGTGGTSLFHYTLHIYNSTFGFWQQIGQSPLGNGFTYAPVTFSSLYADCYKIIMDDSLGCVDTIDVCLTEPAEIVTNTSAISCDSYNWDGFAYNFSGIYTNVFTSVNGCDSTVNLDLTITSCPGCTDSLANNYNPFATVDDSTCLYSPFIIGCTDSTAINYDPLATVDDSSCCYSSGQMWSQIGQDIDGEAAGDQSGTSISLSSDGNILAIGTPSNDGNGQNVGHVRIYENIGGSWSQIGQDIDGEATGDDASGTSVSLSNDGSIVAIGAPYNDGNGFNSGHVRVYENTGGSWFQIGQDIDGEAVSDRSGSSVSLSSYGNTVAIGARGNDGNGFDSGHVRIYQNIGGSWSKIGQDIDGESIDDESGWSISLSSDGNTVAISAPQNNGNGLLSGHVRVYENTGGSWSQIGQDIDGEAVSDMSGWSISLSSDGNIIAISAEHNDGNGNNSGHVRIYENILGSWTQLGQDIDGKAANDHSGRSVSLSSDGNTVAIGAPYNDVNGSNSGYVRIYENISGTWSQIGQDIYGEATNDYSGHLSLSSDGNTVAIGAPYNDGNGFDSGHVRIFEFSSSTPCSDLGCLDPLALNFDPFATVDDSSCVYPIYGCIDSLATNFNSFANISDSSCTYCYVNADIIPDTIYACDSVEICIDTIIGGSYSWLTSNMSSYNASIGDFFQGGIIFYLDGNGGGLITTPSDQSSGSEWGCWGISVSGADGTAIGTGAQNTIDIINAYCSPNTFGNLIAANICDALTLGGYSDWHLPSRDELQDMYGARVAINATANANGGSAFSTTYWSSTESSNNLNAWTQNLQTGIQNSTNDKFNSFYVRAIRSVSSFLLPEIDSTNCIWISNSGWNYITVTDSSGCTATDSVYVDISNPSSSIITVSSCDSYDWNGVTYSTTGQYSNTYTGVNSCDSVVTLDLTINNSSSDTITINSCESYDWDGVTYDSSGVFTNIYSDINGCDSVVTLDLYVGYGSSSLSTITACDSFTWNSILFNSSTLYTVIFTNSVGCDSIASLDLTITNSSSTTFSDSTCDVYVWDGVSYDSTGLYTNIYTGLNGCDSSVTLDLLVLGCYGCTDPLACNYDSTATIDDGSCLTIYGCTDSLAFNYDSLATCDDGSCIPIIYGCTDSSAVNYYAGANTDDGSCIYAGCTDSLASNYDSLATIDDGSCTYLQLGCTDSLACNYDPLALIDDSTCLSNYGCTDPNALNYDSLANCEDFSCIYPVYGCTDPNAINYYLGANVDDGSCLYAGCTDTLACNYDSIAFFDDGSCLTDYGCTDSLALNYDSTATCDDGSCIYVNPCNSPKPTGLYAFDVIDTRAKIGWDNMNDSSCMVWKYFVRYREVGTNSWTTKSAGVGNGLCNFGLNTVTKQLLNLSPSTTYEFKMKAFYCGGTSSNYSPTSQFTTAAVCPDMINLTATTFNGNQAKVRFNWDTTGAYVFARVLLRVDTAGAAWQTAGGFGVYFPTFFVNKFGLQSGESYRAQGRTFCDSNITAYRSPTWTAPIFWTQPGTIRSYGGHSITHLEVYPNPSRDVFNITFSSDKIQDLGIRILNLVGAEVYREDKQQFIGEYNKQINLNKYGKGVYFLEIETSTGVVNKKLILQ